MIDYEQLYYDLLQENKQLKRKINELEEDLNLINNKDKEKLNIKKEILKEFKKYKNRRNKNEN